MNNKFYSIYNLLVGGCDITTGLLLVFFPNFTLSLMFINQIPLEIVYLQFIGVFVFSIGLAYWLPFFANKEKKEDWTESIWAMTAIARSSVALFVLIQIINNQLTFPWLSVVIADSTFATLQVFFLKKR